MLPAEAAQRSDDELTRRLRADLERHASFGEKFPGSPGDLATAAWIAERLRASGYRVDETTFDAPYFVKRAARLRAGGARVDVVPPAPVVPTGAQGVAGRLALVDGGVGDVRDRIALVIFPSGRHAALFPRSWREADGDAGGQGRRPRHRHGDHRTQWRSGGAE